MRRPFFFGYGSLVNRGTHSYQNASPARISGWRRAWRHSPVRAVSFLTAVPCPDTEIDGLVAEVPGHDWCALDAREYAYERLYATTAVSHAIPDPADIAIYAIPAGKHQRPGPDHPVLLSYLDVVIQGYLAEFGEEGVARFFATTDGWDATILDDRAAPVYSRHRETSDVERQLVDDHLASVSAIIRRA
ncbi:gamma-glutamylcyclotransferase family protein [Aliiroseovarius sp. YM-037]|uniref:gamma-glutamylcyclotransferase family protein n=1 Tax=Aliiroseovarius sp. YM-037 TaxID=3341728 RepID=UPI003A806C74